MFCAKHLVLFLITVDSAPPSQDEDTISEGSSVFSNCADFANEETESGMIYISNVVTEQSFFLHGFN